MTKFSISYPIADLNKPNINTNSIYLGTIYYKLLTRYFMRKQYVQYCHKGKKNKDAYNNKSIKIRNSSSWRMIIITIFISKEYCYT